MCSVGIFLIGRKGGGCREDGPNSITLDLYCLPDQKPLAHKESWRRQEATPLCSLPRVTQHCCLGEQFLCTILQAWDLKRPCPVNLPQRCVWQEQKSLLKLMLWHTYQAYVTAQVWCKSSWCPSASDTHSLHRVEQDQALHRRGEAKWKTNKKKRKYYLKKRTLIK